MGLWGKSTSADSRPKFLKGDNADGAGGRKEDALATTRGWELKQEQRLAEMIIQAQIPRY